MNRLATDQASDQILTATLELGGDNLTWTIIRVPLDVEKVWGKRGQLKVKGEINGFAFCTSLFPTGEGTHIIVVNKKMQAGGRVTVGTSVAFRIDAADARCFRKPKCKVSSG